MSGPPRNSPPFPTRRSSDLCCGPSQLLPPRGFRHWAPTTSVSRRSRRSEEHTSELQSRLHLVCRLFFLNVRPPPEFTPFPYTTLFRSMLRTESVAPSKRLSTLGSDHVRFQTQPPVCYPASWHLPGPDPTRLGGKT